MTIDDQNLENNLLEQAIEAVYKETGLEFHITHTEFVEKGFHYDATVEIEGYEHLKFTTKIKRWAQQANFGAVSKDGHGAAAGKAGGSRPGLERGNGSFVEPGQ